MDQNEKFSWLLIGAGLICLIVGFLAAITHGAEATTVTASELITALIQVESAGDDNAIGDTQLADKAYGCLQVRQPCVDDYNRAHSTSHQAKDCLGNRQLSVQICEWYTNHYATEQRLGHAPTDEDRARIWNGGPNGFKKQSTAGYWTRVRAVLGK